MGARGRGAPAAKRDLDMLADALLVRQLAERITAAGLADARRLIDANHAR